MDLWVVAAAAGAGYLAKNWQNLLRDGESKAELSSGVSKFEKPESPPLTWQLHDKNCPFRRLARRKRLGEDVSTDKEQVSHGASTVEVASTGGFDGEKLVNSGYCEDRNILSLSSFPPGFSRNESLLDNGGGIGLSDDISDNSGDLLPEPSSGEMGTFHGFVRNGSSLRTKQSHGHVKPLSSLESCLMAQLYKEHAEMEEYVLGSIPSPSAPTVRPLFVIDGGRIISRASNDSFSARIGTEGKKQHKEVYSEENETVFGVPPLPKIGSMEFPRKIKIKTGKGRGGRLRSSGKTICGKHLHPQGSPDGMLLFCLGISIGVISSVITNKREVDKLKELLTQTENLVQDLQEELEMKDSLTVKELANEDYESHDKCDNSHHNSAPNAFSPEQNLDESTKYHGEEPHDQKPEKNSGSMSIIEAELEAELERLELNMNSSSLEGRLSNLVELDPDIIADIVQGELRANMVREQAGDQPDSDRDTSGTSTTHSTNYAVSPRELSLRLHEIIQSRLEERVKELETALQNSQRKEQLVESEHMNSWRDFSNSELGSSSTQESPIAIGELTSISLPLVINLSREALDQHHEDYEEFMKKSESEEEDLQSGAYKSNHREVLHSFNESVIRDRNGGDKKSRTFIPYEARTLEEHISTVQGSNDVVMSGDENDYGDDEMEKLLIKQIVEKTKQGSPIVFNIQRELFSKDEIEH